jgi:hypothetical protein
MLNSIMAEYMRPGLFKRIISIEAVCNSMRMDDPLYIAGEKAMIERSKRRRYRWANRDEVRAAFLRRPFFQCWDKEMLDVHLVSYLAQNSQALM